MKTQVQLFLLSLLSLLVLASCNSTGSLVIGDDDDDVGDDDDAGDDDDDVDDDDDDDDDDRWEGDYDGFFGIFSTRGNKDEAEMVCFSEEGFSFSVDASGEMNGMGTCLMNFSPPWEDDENWVEFEVSFSGSVEENGELYGVVEHSSGMMDEVIASEASGTLDGDDPKADWEGWFFAWELDLGFGNGPGDSPEFFGVAWSE